MIKTTKKTLILVFLLNTLSCSDKKRPECHFLNKTWYMNTLIKNTESDKKDSIFFYIKKDTIFEKKYMYYMSEKNLVSESKTFFYINNNKIITSDNDSLNYLFFKKENSPRLLIYNAQTEEPSYLILKTDDKINLDKVKTYKEAKSIVSHILVE